MNYRFICAIHYFELEKKEISISLPSGSISNERKMLVETFDNNLSIGTLGVHSIDEITEAPSYYIVEGAFENAKTKAACDAYGTQVTFAFLRQIQTFIGSFWMLRDNCAYVRDGFLYVYDKDIADGCTFKALEALLANTTTELSHRVAERVAVLIGNTKEERCEIYAIVKKSYDVRSKIAHGDFIKGNEDDIRRYSEKLDIYLRQLLNLTEPYEQEKNKIEDYYLGLLMA